MQKLIELKKDESVLVSSIPEKYLKPDYVYIPIKKEDKLLVSPHEKVKIGHRRLSRELHGTYPRGHPGSAVCRVPGAAPGPAGADGALPPPQLCGSHHPRGGVLRPLPPVGQPPAPGGHAEDY